MRILRIGLMIFCSGILMTLIGGGIWGCALLNKPPAHLHESELRYWDDGMKAFQGGEYNKALKLFETLSQEVKDESLRRRTLYALACIRLIQAKDADEFNKAMISWDLWSRLAPMEKDDEDPRMLAPLLKRIASLKPGKDQACKKLLRAKEKQIEDLRHKIETLETIHKDIRHQIEALETIHREIQEKKKKVSSP